MNYSQSGFSVHGILQARILEWVAIPSPGDLTDPRIKSASPVLVGGFFTTEPPGKPTGHLVQFSSVAQSCPTLCDPMNRSVPGLPVHHQLPDFTQTHVHQVGDAIQPSHLCRPLLLLSPIPPSIRVFSNESTLRMRWPKYWSFSFSIIPSKEHPGLISFRMDWLDLLAVQGILKSLLQHHRALPDIEYSSSCYTVGPCCSSIFYIISLYLLIPNS